MASFVVFEDPVLAPGDGHAAALQQKAGKPAAGADKENMDPARREREREAHEHSIARGELRCTASEQLDRWIQYLKWAQRSGLPKQDVLGLLERCTKTFKADKALRPRPGCECNAVAPSRILIPVLPTTGPPAAPCMATIA